MPPLPRRLSLLKGRQPASAGAILAEAVACAEPEEIPAIAQAALETGHGPALAAVIRYLHRFGPAGFAQFDAVRSPLGPAVRAVLARPTPQTAENVIRVIARRGEASLAGHLVDLLQRTGRDWEDIAEQAAGALLDVTVAVVGPCGRRRAEPEAMRQIDEALAAAGREFRLHRQEAVLLAAAIMAPRAGPCLKALLGEDDHPLVLALRGVAERIGEPLVRGNLIRWLGFEPLAGSVARWFHRLQGPQAHTQALRDGHLLLAPKRRRRLRRMDRPLQCVPSLTAAVALPAPAQAHVPALLGALDLSPHMRHQRLADMIALPSPIARLRALQALLGRPGRRTAEAVGPFCFDRDRAVARLAAQHMAGDRQEADPALLARLERSRHEAVARRAAVRLARSAVPAYFQRWRHMPPCQRLASALCLLAADRERFVGGLRMALIEGDTEIRSAAVLLARRLGLAESVEGELIRLACGGPARVASASVTALAACRSPQAYEALRKAVQHEDGRVKANAIEALASTAQVNIIDSLSPFTGSEQNRPRANAVRAVLRADRTRGLAALRRMLADLRPLHRVSAIWVARAARMVEAGPDLERLACRDRLPEIRTRALGTMRLLKGQAQPQAMQEARR
jgi:hypothetical protein